MFKPGDKIYVHSEVGMEYVNTTRRLRTGTIYTFKKYFSNDEWLMIEENGNVGYKALHFKLYEAPQVKKKEDGSGWGF